jgi:two-component system OmpR family response regulator
MAVNTLVVEDSKGMQSALQELFSTLGGFNIIAMTASESEATDLLHAHQGRWQLLTLDLLITEGSGFNLIHRAKSMQCAGKVVVLSDFATPGIEKKCRDLGADAVFTKGDAKAFAAYVGGLVPPAQRPCAGGESQAD